MIVIGYHMILISVSFVGFGGIVTFFLFLFLQYSEILGSGAFKTVYGSDTHLLLFSCILSLTSSALYIFKFLAIFKSFHM